MTELERWALIILLGFVLPIIIIIWKNMRKP